MRGDVELWSPRLARGVQVAHSEVVRLHFSPNGFNLGADVHDLRTARVEPATGGRFDGTGYISFQDDPFLFLVRIQNRHSGHKRLGVRMKRLSQQFFI